MLLYKTDMVPTFMDLTQSHEENRNTRINRIKLKFMMVKGITNVKRMFSR